ncbi:RNA polymerase sigma factor [Labilithrix luteola]|nr:sigma-70 family RNA polymerase sigma factor [Labilithrix luteola]
MYFAYVWKTARRLGVRSTELDDVVQETFLTIHKLLDTYESRGTERAWLFSVLFRIVQRHRRSRGRWSALVEGGTDVDRFPSSSAHGPEKKAETSETVRVLKTILDNLEPEKRAVLILADLEDRPVHEIAEILGINRHTAASRLRAARAYLEAAMARHGAHDGWRYK